MKTIICKQCGSNRFKQNNNILICEYCGTKIIAPEIKKDTNIELNNDVDVLLKKCKTDPANAKKYANLILDIDPTNEEVKKYL